VTAGATSSENVTRATRWRARLDVGASVAMLLAAVGLLWVNFGRPLFSAPGRRELPVPAQPLSLAGAQLKGSRAARVAMLEYSDFQCPFCARFAREVWPTLQSRYVDSGALLVAFRNYPLPIHPLARGAAEGALCAADQGKLWELHDFLFADQLHLDGAGLNEAASELRLNVQLFGECRQKSRVIDRVRADSEEGRRLGVSGTPSFFLGYVQPDGTLSVKRTMTGARALGDFDEAIRALQAGRHD
jgi:predicted DsbA family dithiol-disulfide isomerase